MGTASRILSCAAILSLKRVIQDKKGESAVHQVFMSGVIRERKGRYRSFPSNTNNIALFGQYHTGEGGNIVYKH